jgi:hypothetical protein
MKKQDSAKLSSRIDWLISNRHSIVIALKNQDSIEKAIDVLQNAGQHVIDIHSPHFIHLKSIAPKKKSPGYGYIAGIGGILGFLLMLLLILYVMNKPRLLLGNMSRMHGMEFIPVLFTVSILMAGLALLFAFSLKNHLLPGQQNQIIDPLCSNDTYLIIIEKNMSLSDLKTLLADIDFTDIYEHPFLKQHADLPLPLKIK